MKMNMIPCDGLSGTQTFILISMAIGLIFAVDLIIIGICKLYDLISMRFKEWKKIKSKNYEK